MPWNPDTYNQFKNIRYQPFFDLIALIAKEKLEHGVDIGCGTGEQTMLLSRHFPNASFLGIDSSPEMLENSKSFASEKVTFNKSSVQDFLEKNKTKWDLIFSNAALQWSGEHAILFPHLISLLSDDGQLAIQMPVQKENMLNILLHDLVQEEPFQTFLGGWKIESPLLSVDQYARLMFNNGLKDIQVIQKVYPIIADNADTLYQFIAGSALIPYMDRMPGAQQKLFATEFKKRIEQSFKPFPAMYAFKRLLLYGRKKAVEPDHFQPPPNPL